MAEPKLYLQKKLSKAKKSTLLRELRDEFSEAPEEIRDDFDVEEHTEREAERRREYEEENLMRTSVVKKKKKSKHNRAAFDDMDDFDDLAAFLDEREANDGEDELQKLREQKRTQKRTKSAVETRTETVSFAGDDDDDDFDADALALYEEAERNAARKKSDKSARKKNKPS